MNQNELLRELRATRCYPHAPREVEIVQTHLSIVCLVGHLVYKLKKPLRLPFVDFSTLELRRTICRDEVRLNRRLCPDVYLGTAALRRDANGLRFAPIGDDDSAADLDVAVVMQRLPQERMLDVLLAQQAVEPAQIEALAAQVAAFHERAQRGQEVLAAGAPRKLAAFARANFTELADRPGHGLPAALLNALATATASDFDALLPTLQRRATEGRVCDGHGDLHARNICMTTPATIYDCLEFSAEFRCGDVATENAFVAMDLRYRGAAALAATYVAAYVRASGDDQLPALLPPLVAYRAMVRAKVAAIAATEAEMPADARAASRQSALRHLVLAAACTIEHRGAMWLVLCGPPASGKSHLARALAEATGWPHLNTDAVRKQLAGVPIDQPARAEHYTAGFSQRTYDALLANAAELTRAGQHAVVLDGNFPTPERRAQARRLAAANGAALHLAYVDVDAATALARAEARRGQASISDAGPDEALRLRRQFVPPTAAEVTILAAVDGAAPVDRSVASLLATLLREGPPTAQPTAAQPTT